LSETLPWPPTKKDLERLYLVERLSAARIAAAYGLSYPNPKTAESTVLAHLKRHGIPRRHRADHRRKVTREMEDEWVRRYEAGESLKEIAGKTVDSVTVWYHLKARGVTLRDKVEAQIEAVSKYPRKPFEGDSIERAYMMGLRYGDLHAVMHGRAVRIKLSTTHLAMAELFESVFGRYSHVSMYPKEGGIVGYEWDLQCDLDKSFGFLLDKAKISDIGALSDGEFLSFLAGFFDAEGSVLFHKKTGIRYAPELAIKNTDSALMDLLFSKLKGMGYHPAMEWRDQDMVRGRISGPSRIGRISLVRFVEVRRMLSELQVRHGEKVAKIKILKKLTPGSKASPKIVDEWTSLLELIRRQTATFVESAKAQFVAREAIPESSAA
jgi:hypothetical protein